MHKLRKILCLSFIILLLGGCSIVYIEKESIDDIVKLLETDTKLKTISLDGYSYYLPQGVNLKESQNLNSILYYNGNKMYLYVDMVSYYHKQENTYKENSKSYYSKKLSFKGKEGYLEINELENKYFIEFMYNYSKIEGYTNKKDLNKTLTNMVYILNSVRYKDKVIESLIGEAAFNYKEEQYNIYKTTGSENNEYLDIIEGYDDGRKDSKDEDVLELNEVE